ncbi:MAG: hypothetical protein KAG64_02865 [Bacteroidales bacterium]|nr:hypothetical protein [Bacteroidales bacterium]
MDFSQYLESDHPYFFYLLGGIILLVYILLSRRKLRDLGDDNLRANEASQQSEEGRIPKGMEHFTSLDKIMKWKVILLVVLMIIGLYLVITQPSN